MNSMGGIGLEVLLDRLSVDLGDIDQCGNIPIRPARVYSRGIPAETLGQFADILETFRSRRRRCRYDNVHSECISGPTTDLAISTRCG